MEPNVSHFSHYLDTSALIKLLIIEPDSENIRNFFEQNRMFYTTSVCFAEALGVLKAKMSKKRGELTPEEYIETSKKLMIWIFGDRIQIDEVPLSRPDNFKEAEQLVKKYNIDLADAMQIITLLKGKFSKFIDGSMLITADNDLSEAARKEKIRVWNCVKETKPNLHSRKRFKYDNT